VEVDRKTVGQLYFEVGIIVHGSSITKTETLMMIV